MKKHRSFLTAAFVATVGVAMSACVYGTSDKAMSVEDAQRNGLCAASQHPVSQLDLGALPSRSADAFYNNSDNRQFLLFGDTDHSDHRIHDYFYSKEQLDRLAVLGIKHIFIERAPSQSQQGIDDLVSGQITPEEFAKNYAGGRMWDRDGAEKARVRIAEGMVYASTLGMKIHASDVKTKGIASKEEREALYGYYRDMSAEFNRLCPDAESMTDAFYQYYVEQRADYLKKWGRRFNEIMQERYNDTNRVNYIKNIAKGERSAIFYGAAHFSGAKSIKELLGPQNTLHINLFPDEGKAAEYGRFISGSDFADVIDHQRIYKVGKIDFQTSPDNSPALKP